MIRAALVFLACVAVIPHHTAKVASASAQKRLFRKNCARCHGKDGNGGFGPSLHHLTLSESQIRTILKEGIPEDMPSFKRLPVRTRATLAFYVESWKAS